MRTEKVRTEELLALGVFGRGSRLSDRVEMLMTRGRVFSPRVSSARVMATGIALLACMAAASLAPRLIAFAQQPRFEVGSVKPNHSGEQRWMFPPLVGDRYTATNASLGMLLTNAFHILPFQIQGGPSWMNSDRFDIEAKAAGTPSREQVSLMLQSLLVDRFKLVLHRETKDLPVYELIAAKGGVKFKEAKCVGEPSRDNPCGGFSIALRGSMRGREVGVDQLAGNLSSLLSRTVIDKTGLAGKYDFDLIWTPDGTTLRGPGDPDAPSPDPDGPSIFTALQEQLGLELKSAKGRVEILVIEHVEKPDAN